MKFQVSAMVFCSKTSVGGVGGYFWGGFQMGISICVFLCGVFLKLGGGGGDCWGNGEKAYYGGQGCRDDDEEDGTQRRGNQEKKKIPKKKKKEDDDYVRYPID